MPNKVLLVGIDGLNPELVNRLIEEGKMPFFKKLRDQSASGHLISTIPPLSAPAWSSIFTGLNPGNHGIFGWITEEYNDNQRVVNIHNSKSLQGQALWDILNRYNKKTIVVNVPLTYPPYPIKGVLVSGFPAPVNELSTADKASERKLRKMFPRYKMDADLESMDYSKIDKTKLVEDSKKSVNARHNLVRYLLQEEEWEFFTVVYTVLDRIQHVFWPYQDEHYPRHIEDKEEYEHVVEEFYCTMDRYVEQLVAEMDEETQVLIVSDHGFESMYKKFDLRKWMIREGYLKGKESSVHRKSILRPLYKSLNKLGFIDMKRIADALPDRDKGKLISSDICWMGTGGFYVKDIPGTDKEKVANEIIEKLLAYRDPKNGEQVVKYGYKKDEIYHGKHINRSLDVILLPAPGYDLSDKNVEEIVEELPWHAGNHVSSKVRKGAFYAIGSKTNSGTYKVDCLDITPSILKLLDIEEDQHLDGKPRTDLWT